jgi:CheY-like chemotaxis protein
VNLLDCASKDVTVFTFVDPAIPQVLKGDPGRLRQVLLNIVGNALKFTAAGSVVISAQLESSANGLVVVRFTVQDTGIGMSRETLDRLFEPFVQADGSTTRRFGGTGLGLSIARRLIELMGGAIDVRSEPGIGTAFSFTTQFGEVGAEQRSVETSDRLEGLRLRESLATAVRSRARILVVEDNEINRRVAARQLQLLGHEFEIVRDGREALSSVHARAFDLILMDCYMPEMDGYETTAAIRCSTDSRVRNVAIVAMTASALERDRRRCLEAGMDDYVSKPVSLAELGEVVARQLARRGFNFAQPIAG